MNERICGFCVISLKCSINQFLEYRHLTKAIVARLLNNFTFVLQRFSKWKFLIIFCYTKVLFPRHFESNGTHIFLEQTVQSIQKTFFQKYSEKYFHEGKRSSLRSKQYFRKEKFVMEFILFSVMLKASSSFLVFSSIAWPFLSCQRSNIA